MVSGEKKLINETIVKATTTTTTTNTSTDPCIFPLSNLDRLVSGIPVLIVYAYRKPPAGDFPSVLHTIKTSLSQALNHFSPFAGQLSQSDTGEAQVLCNNRGVKLIEAHANVSMSKLDFYGQKWTDSTFPLTVQITRYNCGGFTISWIFDHVLADAYGFIKFLSAWCEIARTKKLSTAVVFNLDRCMFHPRSPSLYNHTIRKSYGLCGMRDNVLDTPPNCATERRLYLVKGSTLESLRETSSKGGSKRTRTEALSAYLWKLMAKAFDKLTAMTNTQSARWDGRWTDGRGLTAVALIPC